MSYLQLLSDIIEASTKNGVVPVATSNVKTLLKRPCGEVQDNFIVYL